LPDDVDLIQDDDTDISQDIQETQEDQEDETELAQDSPSEVSLNEENEDFSQESLNFEDESEIDQDLENQRQPEFSEDDSTMLLEGDTEVSKDLDESKEDAAVLDEDEEDDLLDLADDDEEDEESEEQDLDDDEDEFEEETSLTELGRMSLSKNRLVTEGAWGKWKKAKWVKNSSPEMLVCGMRIRYDYCSYCDDTGMNGLEVRYCKSTNVAKTS
jgi:hypothetical protein